MAFNSALLDGIFVETVVTAVVVLVTKSAGEIIPRLQ